MSSRTLLDAVSPPEGHFGQVGLFMAMSATTPFLEQVVRRFTGLGRDRRAATGLPAAYLVLDGHAGKQRRDLLSPLAVPGLLELAPNEKAKKGLLHAKLALLAFGKSRMGPPTSLRLVVTTGNWTDRSARQQLELVWSVDVGCNARGVETGADPQDRVDIAAAAAFTRRVLRRYDLPARGAGQLAYAARLRDLLDRFEQAGARQRARARFCHSLDRPLLDALTRAVQGKKELNLLICGSGSFEAEPKGKAPGSLPTVLEELSSLLATGDATKCVAVQPGAAGALAAWAPKSAEDGWSVRLPSDPIRRRNARALHAKFVLVGHLRGRQVQRGTLYLGSGNLTNPGFLRGAPKRGNLECGVILPFSGAGKFEEVRDLLYVSPKEATGKVLETGVPAEQEEDATGSALIATPPLRGVRLGADEVGDFLELHWRAGLPAGATYRIRVGDREQQVVAGTRRLRLVDPRGVGVVRVVRDGARLEPWVVAVEAEDGAWVAATQEPPASFEDALARLLDFPPSADEEAEDGEGDEAEDDAASDRKGVPPVSTASALRTDVASYPVQKAMEFLEGLGTHQARVPYDLVDDWLQHLETALESQFPAADLQAWRDSKVPFRRALHAAGFRPEKFTKEQSRRYRRIIDRFVAGLERP